MINYDLITLPSSSDTNSLQEGEYDLVVQPYSGCSKELRKDKTFARCVCEVNAAHNKLANSAGLEAPAALAVLTHAASKFCGRETWY
eukprot:1166775-Pleurochrysis_carterae.AAC.3